jgi:3,4-dihydroxy-2-butanone 4-phosphate synthase
MIVDIEKAISDVKNGKPIIIFDKDNENEGDLMIATEKITVEHLNFMLNNCKGIICQTLPEEKINALNIPILKKSRSNITGQTNFVYPVDHVKSETGISSSDRLMIMKELINENASEDNIVMPGHQQLLRISPGGVIERQGHTESSSELVSLAGFYRSAIICEILGNNGVPLRLSDMIKFAELHDINIVMLNDIYQYCLCKSNIIVDPPIFSIKNPYNLLHGKTAIVTGGSSGIGKSIKETLVSNDVNVIDLSRTNGYDITNYDKINDLVKNKLGPVDFLINCAGFIEESTISDMKIDDWNNHIAVNLTAPFNLMKTVSNIHEKSLKAIVNISSASTNKTRIGWSGYSCTKSALNSLSMIAAEELKSKGIKVFIVSPSKTNTPLIHRLFDGLKEKDLIDPADLSGLILNIMCGSMVNTETGILYSVKKRK